MFEVMLPNPKALESNFESSLNSRKIDIHYITYDSSQTCIFAAWMILTKSEYDNPETHPPTLFWEFNMQSKKSS